MKSARKRKQRGFSLLEILITLTIVALIATLVGPRLMSSLDRSKTTAARIQAKALKSATDSFRMDTGRYPTSEEGLSALVQAPAGLVTWRGPYLDTAVPADPWGRPYIYEAPADGDSPPRVGSLGSDGQPGGTGSAADVFSDDLATN